MPKIIRVDWICKSGQCGNVSADSAGFVFVHLHSVNKPHCLSVSLSFSVFAVSLSISGLVNAGVCMCFLS